VLGLICTLLVSESLFDASLVAAQVAKGQPTHFLSPLSLGWFFGHLLGGASLPALQGIHLTAYTIHDLTFSSFCASCPWASTST